MSVTPPLGDEYPSHTTCLRETGTGLCGRRAVAHIFWDITTENSLSCEEHLAEARSSWPLYAVHDVAWACTCPGKHYDHERNECFIPEESDPALRIELGANADV